MGLLADLVRRHIGQKLFNKVFLVYVAAQFAFFLCIALPMIRRIFATLRDRDVYLHRQIVQGIAEGFSGSFRTANQFNRDLYDNSDLADEVLYFMQHGLEDYYRYRLDRYTQAREFFLPRPDRLFFDFLAQYPQVQQVVLHSAVRGFAYRYQGSVARLLEPQEMEVKLEAVSRDPSGSFVPAHIVQSVAAEPVEVFSIRFPIYEMQSGREIGLLFVDYRTTSIAGRDTQYLRYLRGGFSVVARGIPIFTSDGPAPRQGRPDGDLVSIDCPGLPGCTILHVIDPGSIRSEHQPIVLLLYLLVGAFIMLTTLLVAYLTGAVNRRIRPIVDGMAQFQAGNLHVRLPVPSRDELSTITESFNRMGQELDVYIKRTYILRLAQQEAEMKRLEAQINPHFLNNTLEAIRMKALTDGQSAAEMIFHLSRMFRDMHRQREHMATLESEMKLCREYGSLCELRYGRCFRVTFELESGHGKLRIPKWLLQPVMENYMVHGLDPRRKDNHLRIAVCGQDRDIEITFTDNGRGIAPERVQHIRASLGEPEPAVASGIGLPNVHRRIVLAYGDPYGVDIASQPRLGTRVTLRLPMVARGVS